MCFQSVSKMFKDGASLISLGRQFHAAAPARERRSLPCKRAVPSAGKSSGCTTTRCRQKNKKHEQTKHGSSRQKSVHDVS